MLARAALIALLALLVGDATARADLLGRSPETLSGPGAFGPDPVVTPRGHTLVTWRNGVYGELYGSWRAPGGTFGARFKIGGFQGDSVATGDDYVALGRADVDSYVTLIRPGEKHGTNHVLSTSDDATAPELAADGKGNVIAVVKFNSGGPVVAWSRPPGGTFGSPQIIEPQADFAAVPAMNSAGDAAIATSRGNGEVLVSVRPAGQATFGPPERTGITGISFTAPSVAVTPNGDVAVANFAATGPGIVPSNPRPNFAFRPAGGSFSLTPLFVDGPPLALLTSTGSALTIADTGPGKNVVQLRDRLPDGSLTAPATITTSPVCSPSATSTFTGNVTIVYQHPCVAGPSIDPATQMDVVERPAHGTPTAPVEVGPRGTLGFAVATNRIGSTAIAWLTDGAHPAQSRVQAAVRDGSAELALELAGKTLSVKNGRLRLPLACSGLRHCAGSVTVQRAGGSGKARTRTKVRVRRGKRLKKSVRVPRSALVGHRPRLKITFTLPAQKGAAKRRSRVVRVKRS